jgi:hypothetical protein
MASPAIITSQSMPNQLRKDIDEMYVTTLMGIDSEYTKVLKVESAPAGRSYVESEFVGLGLGHEIGEAESVPYSTPAEGNTMAYYYKQYGLGYGVTDLALKDDHHGKIVGLAKDLAESQNELIEIESMKLYNEAENTTINKVKDGKALCAATGHSLLSPAVPFQQPGGGTGTTTANKLYNIPDTASDLSETTLMEAYEYYDNMVNEKGFKKKMHPGLLMVSIDDQYIAHRLLTQEFGSTFAAGGLGGSPYDVNKNAGNPSNGFINPYQVVVLRHMDTDRWFFNADEHDNKLMWKEQPEQKSMYDFDTRTTRYSSVMRFGLKSYEYRGTYGNIDGITRLA